MQSIFLTLGSLTFWNACRRNVIIPKAREHLEGKISLSKHPSLTGTDFKRLIFPNHLITSQQGFHIKFISLLNPITMRTTLAERTTNSYLLCFQCEKCSIGPCVWTRVSYILSCLEVRRGSFVRERMSLDLAFEDSSHGPISAAHFLLLRDDKVPSDTFLTSVVPQLSHCHHLN